MPTGKTMKHYATFSNVCDPEMILDLSNETMAITYSQAEREAKLAATRSGSPSPNMSPNLNVGTQESPHPASLVTSKGH